MAGTPPKPPPPTLAAGSSSPKPAPLPFFHPSDEQLIVSYLRPRVVSGSGTKVDFIHEADLYSAHPNKLSEKYSTATAGADAWYFFTLLHPMSSAIGRIKRTVKSGWVGTWVSNGAPVKDVMFNGQRIGWRRGFAFEEMVDGKSVKTAWRMMELRLDPDEGGQEAGSSNLLALCRVYGSCSRIQIARAEDESSMAVAKADGEAPAESSVVTPGLKGADEEIGAETAAGPGLKRKAGDKDSGAETVASSPGRQNKADGESADAATTAEIFADSKNTPDAAEKTEPEEPGVPRDSRFYNFFDYSSAPLDATEKAEQEEPRDSRFYDFFGDSSASLHAPEEAKQEPRDPRDRPHQFNDFN